MPRLNKRQQRELASLRGPEASPTPETTQSDDDEALQSSSTRMRFAALEVMEVPDHGDEDDQIDASLAKASKSQRKGKKKTKTDNVGATGTQSGAPISLNKKSKKAGKAPVKDDVDSPLEQLVGDLTLRSPVGSASTSVPALQRCKGLLAVSPGYLDSEAELRRFFGSKVISGAKTPAKRRNFSVRSQLTHPPGTWFMKATSQGLAMRSLGADELHRKPTSLPGDSWWTVDHSNSYKQVQVQFLSIVQIGDHAGFMQLLREHPWHIDTLLQMSEVARHHEDHSQASDFVERAIFAFERSFNSTFNITTGSHRLDFDHIENRSFFLALHRHIINLQRRGTTRTAFEFARLLLSLDPGRDPHGALFYLDYLAVRSGQNEWLLSMWDTWTEIVKTFRPSGSGDEEMVSVGFIPGWWWARALAMWNLEISRGDKLAKESTEVLQEAIKTYPQVLPVLADKAGIALSSDVRGHAAFRIAVGWDSFNPGESTVNLLSHLYAHRSVDLWKQPNVSSWLVSAIDTTLLTSLTSSKVSPSRAMAISRYSFGTPQNIVRHLLVTENRSLFPFLGPRALSDSMVAYDPVPPITSVSAFDDSYFRGVAMGAARRRLNRDQNPELRMDDEMQQQVMQEMILAEIQRHRRGGGGMPGDFDQQLGEPVGPDIEEQEELEREEDDEVADGEDNEQNPQVGGGLLQAVYNLIWGRTRPNQGDEPVASTETQVPEDQPD